MGLDLLTWSGIRATAQIEAMNLGPKMVLAQNDLTRPPVKWFEQQKYWAKHAVPVTPKAGDVIYARAAWRSPWREQLVQQVNEPVVLVTTFYDPTIKPTAVEEMFVPTSPITHWFGVQADTTHPQLTAMPLGVEPRIVPLLEDTPRDDKRPILLYLNFHKDRAFLRKDAIRPALWRHFSALPWTTADPWNPTALIPYVQQLGRSKFVLSPPGYGWDCYRTYEAIAMGAIPIVKRRKPITNPCEFLPVLLVDDWNEVTEERLHAEWERRGETRRLPERLTLTFWRTQIERRARQAQELSYVHH